MLNRAVLSKVLWCVSLWVAAGLSPAGQHRLAAQTSPEADEVAQQKLLFNEDADWDLEISLNHPDGVYEIGDALELTVKAPRKCHLHVLNVTPKGEFKVLWPMGDAGSNLVAADQKVTFPDPVAEPRVRFRATAPVGKELIVCLATTAPINLKTTADARRFEKFLKALDEVPKPPLAKLRSFVTTVEPQDSGWVARAIFIETRCPTVKPSAPAEQTSVEQSSDDQSSPGSPMRQAARRHD